MLGQKQTIDNCVTPAGVCPHGRKGHTLRSDVELCELCPDYSPGTIPLINADAFMGQQPVASTDPEVVPLLKEIRELLMGLTESVLRLNMGLPAEAEEPEEPEGPEEKESEDDS